MNLRLTFSIMPALLAASFLASCGAPEKTPSDRVKEILADSSARTLLEQRIADDHEMYMEELHLMIEHVREDTSMRMKLCQTVAADSLTRMALMSILKPEAHPVEHTPGVHDATHVAKKQHHTSPDAIWDKANKHGNFKK